MSKQLSSNILDDSINVSSLRLTSPPQVLSQIPRPTQILSLTHDITNNNVLTLSPLFTSSLTSPILPVTKDPTLSSLFTSHFIKTDGVTEEDNSSGSASGSGEGRASVASFASSIDNSVLVEDSSSKLSSPRNLTPVSMSQLKSNKSGNIVRRNRSPHSTTNVSSPSSPKSSMPEPIPTSPSKHQLLMHNNSSIPSNNINNKYLVKQLRSKSCGMPKPILSDQKSLGTSSGTKPAKISTVFFVTLVIILKIL